MKDGVEKKSSHRREFLKSMCVLVGSGSTLSSWPTVYAEPGKVQFSELTGIDEEFTFALIADPQVNVEETRSAVGTTAQKKLSQTVKEINDLTPQPAFVVFNGDLVGNVRPEKRGDEQVDNFLRRVKPLRPLTILVHGNHDGDEPWEAFKHMQSELNGTEHVLFSWDTGQWHFVALPCNFPFGGEYEKRLMTWLETDLNGNRTRPTMVFEHFHLMPQGLTQLEFYTYEKPFRTELVELMAKYGNVRYVICGHVHNGIKAAQKTAWTYKGMNFITAPTGTASRNFGEEYRQFIAGEDQGDGDTGGGYYLMIDIKGAEAVVRGRVVGVDEEYIFPRSFTAYQDQEPLWFKNVTAFSPNDRLKNGSFNDGLKEWSKPYRYISDLDPGFVAEHDAGLCRSAGGSAQLLVREKGQRWAKDEMLELYQLVKAPPLNPQLRASYYLEREPKRGGGYLRVTGYSGEDLQFLLLFDWGNGNKASNMRMASHGLWVATGEKVGPTELIKLGRRRKAMFWSTPFEKAKWHDISLNLAETCDYLKGRTGSYAELGVDRVLVGFGVWCQPEVDSFSHVWFDDVELVSSKQGAGAPVLIDGSPRALNPSSFRTEFGAKFLS